MAEWELHGPTNLTAEQEPGWDILDEEGWSIAFVWMDHADLARPAMNAESVANLIKTAPKLLEAAHNVLAWADETGLECEFLDELQGAVLIAQELTP